MLNQKASDESELALVAREARSVLARLDTLLKREEKATAPTGALSDVSRKRDRDVASLASIAERNAQELSAIFGEDTMDGMAERQCREQEQADSELFVTSFSDEHTNVPVEPMDADLEEALNEARGGRYVSPLPPTPQPPLPPQSTGHVTIHPVFPNTFKVRNAQQAREQVKAEKAIAAASASPRPVKRKTPLNPALIGAPKPPQPSFQKRGWAGRGNNGQGNKYSKRPYDAEHAERMRRRSTGAAPSKRRVRQGGSSGGRSSGGMSMVDPEERYAEQRDDARSNRDGGSDRGSSGGASAGGYTRGWKGL